MRPLRLELRGFTAFREPAVIDFEGRRLFAITGPTGAGKSSLLDAMTWALYGEVPRVGRATRQLITHGARSMAVRLDFSLRGERYRVSRQAPGSIGARLEQQRPDGEWEPLADRARDVNGRVTALLGLDFQTFTKTVLLPQGAFDTFLRGDEPQRREILSRLLGLDRYAEVGRAARNRAAGANAAASTLRAQLERLDAGSPDAIVALEAEHTALAAQARALEERGALLATLEREAGAHREADGVAARAAEASREGERALVAAGQALAEAERGVAEATALRDRIETERQALGYDEQAHRRLEREAALLEQRRAAQEAVARAEAELREAQVAAGQAGERATVLHGKATRADEALAQALEAQRSERAALAAAAGVALATERALEERIAALEGERLGAVAAVGEREEEGRRLQVLRERLLSQERALQAAERAQAEAGEADQRAATTAEAAGGRLTEAERTAAEAAAALGAAQLQDAALALQRSLQPGDPCPVCGEPVEHVELHPAPALDAAREALAAATAALEAARAEEAAAAVALAAARERLAQTGQGAEGAGVELAAIREQIVDAGVDPDALDQAIARLAGAVEAERRRAAEAAEAAARISEQARDLGLLRASVGDELAVEPGDAGEPAAVAAAFEAAIAAERAASAAVEAAQAASRLAGEAAREGAAEADRAVERAAYGARALERGREQLATLGGEQADAEAVQAALREAKALAARERELEAALREAEQACAGADARGEAAGEAQTRATEAVERLAGEAAAALAASEESRGRLEAAWTGAQGPGPAERERVPALLAAHEGAYRECVSARAVAAERVEATRATAARAAEMREEAAAFDDGGRLAGALEQELHRNRFIAYVQREAMQLLAGDAAERLLQLSNGRYRLAAEGDEFVVVDRLNGDERRSVKTLSGGETFLASLALALSLSERLPEIAGSGGAISLESLFLDEGFGALDQESLDIAIGGLEALAGGRRLIGVISHIPEVAERLSDRIEVVKSGATSSILDRRASRVERTPELVAAGSAEPPDAHDGVGEE